MSLINQVLQGVELRQDNVGQEFWGAQVKPVLDYSSSTIRYRWLKHTMFILAILGTLAWSGTHFHVAKRFFDQSAVDVNIPSNAVEVNRAQKTTANVPSSRVAVSPAAGMSVLDARPQLTRTLFSVWQSQFSNDLTKVRNPKPSITAIRTQPVLPQEPRTVQQADEGHITDPAQGETSVVVSTLNPISGPETGKMDRQVDSKTVVTKQLKPGQEVNQMVQHAIDHEQKGRMSEAINILRQALGQYPQSEEARQLLVGYLFETKQDQEALSLLQSAIKQYPEQAIFSKMLAKWQLGHGQAEAVITTLKPVASVFVQDAEFNWIIAMAYQRMGQHAVALPYFERANSLRPNQPQWVIAYALSLEANGQNIQAIQQFQIALSLPMSERLSEFVSQRLQQLGGAAN